MRRSISRKGHMVLKFGCLGGLTITPLLYYLSGYNTLSKTGSFLVLEILINAAMLLTVYFLANWLFRQKPHNKQ